MHNLLTIFLVMLNFHQIRFKFINSRQFFSFNAGSYYLFYINQYNIFSLYQVYLWRRRKEMTVYFTRCNSLHQSDNTLYIIKEFGFSIFYTSYCATAYSKLFKIYIFRVFSLMNSQMCRLNLDGQIFPCLFVPVIHCPYDKKKRKSTSALTLKNKKTEYYKL